MWKQEGGLVAQNCAPCIWASSVQLPPQGYKHRHKAEESSSMIGDAPPNPERWTASPSMLNITPGSCRWAHPPLLSVPIPEGYRCHQGQGIGAVFGRISPYGEGRLQKSLPTQLVGSAGTACPPGALLQQPCSALPPCWEGNQSRSMVVLHPCRSNWDTPGRQSSPPSRVCSLRGKKKCRGRPEAQTA